MNIIDKIKRMRDHSGQSLVELALILPLLLLMLAGMVEVAFGMFAYMTALDLTREAARFVSVRDYHELGSTNSLHPTDYVLDPDAACQDSALHYYYDAACFFIDPDLNSFLEFDEDKYDDVVITVFTVAGNVVTDRHPGPSDAPAGPDPGHWSLFDDNWQKDCQGNVVETEPTFTNEEVENMFVNTAPKAKGLVLVEGFICYDQMIYIPIISEFIGSPFRIHTYTFMPAPEAIPTPTPIP